ncbi:hypothetical protein [Streptomyces sp. 184]|uniref:hypothetical protein n=1 Tax=Streptomyces sp. 184 TaxID=1827526 RepID=UPI003891C67C
MVTEAVRAALEGVANTSPHLLDQLVYEDWSSRYGRPLRLGKNPTKLKTRILAHRKRRRPAPGTPLPARSRPHFRPSVQALRQIVVQNYHRDSAGHLRRRTAETEDGSGLPPSSRAIVSPYDTSVATHGTGTSSAGRGSPPI